MNYDNIVSASYSYTLMKDNFLYLFMDVITINLSVSIGGLLPIDVNPEGHAVDENMAKTWR